MTPVTSDPAGPAPAAAEVAHGKRIRGVSDIFIVRPIATALLTIGLALAGAIAFFLLPVAPLPQVDFPTISVSASLPGASPETMAATVATPLERALGSIAGVSEMTSNSSLGSSRVTLQFDLDRDINGAARDVQAAINAARALLPTGMPSNPSYRKVNPADSPILILALTSDTLTRGQMYDAASTVLAQRLAQVDGIGQVTISGSALPAVRIELDPNRLSALGISLDEVRTAVTATNANRPKGTLSDDNKQWQIEANDQARTAAEYAPLIVRYRAGNPVHLRDVATIVDSVQDVRNYGAFNGKPAVVLILYKQPNANVIRAVDDVRALLPRLQASIPAAIRLDVVMDRTPTIRASLKEVERALAISFGLVIMVVFLFLRSFRAALIPSVAVPVSIAGTFGVMYLGGYSVDNLSLMALTVATGFVVDDAIVVLENISRHLERGKTAMQAAIDGAREIGFTVLSISLSLIAVFLPILLMGGIVGRLFREFAVVLSAAILMSMVVSLTTTPMMCALLLKARPPTHVRSAPTFGERWRKRMQRGYRRSLGWALRHQPITLLILAAVIGLNVFLYAKIDKGFFPEQDTGRMGAFLRADQSTSFQAMQARLQRYMGVVESDPAVLNVIGFTGGGRGANSAAMFIALKPLKDRNESIDEVIARLRAKTAKEPGARMFFSPAQDIRVGGRGGSSNYQYTLQADELDALRTWEPQIRRAFAKLPQLVDVDSDQEDHGLQTSLVVDRDAAARLGLDMRTIDSTLNSAFGQRQVGVIYNPLNQYRVVLGLAPEFLQSPETLRQLKFTAKGGAQIPLSQFARLELTNTPLSISHQGGTPASTVSFNLPLGGSLSQATAAIEGAMKDLNVPVSVRGSFQGTAKAFGASTQNQPLLILAALITIYLVLGILYESLIHPITILSTLPSAGVGALLALMLFKTEFSLIALIGVILLIGIVKKNAIMMIDFAITRQRESKERADARRALSLQGDQATRAEELAADSRSGERRGAGCARPLALPPGRGVGAATRSARRLGGEPILGAGAAIYKACDLRLRPILMTTMAAIFGAVPLAIGTGDGAELRQPLGISIVGGLILSQVLTLYTTPVVFVCMDRLRGLPGRLRRRWSSRSASAPTPGLQPVASQQPSLS